jgi:hypothetical protein
MTGWCMPTFEWLMPIFNLSTSHCRTLSFTSSHELMWQAWSAMHRNGPLCAQWCWMTTSGPRLLLHSCDHGNDCSDDEMPLNMLKWWMKLNGHVESGEPWIGQGLGLGINQWLAVFFIMWRYNQLEEERVSEHPDITDQYIAKSWKKCHTEDIVGWKCVDYIIYIYTRLYTYSRVPRILMTT